MVSPTLEINASQTCKSNSLLSQEVELTFQANLRNLHLYLLLFDSADVGHGW